MVLPLTTLIPHRKARQVLIKTNSTWQVDTHKQDKFSKNKNSTWQVDTHTVLPLTKYILIHHRKARQFFKKQTLPGK